MAAWHAGIKASAYRDAHQENLAYERMLQRRRDAGITAEQWRQVVKYLYTIDSLNRSRSVAAQQELSAEIHASGTIDLFNYAVREAKHRKLIDDGFAAWWADVHLGHIK